MAVSEVSRAIAVAAFVASYVGLALGRVPGFRIDRTGVAIIGAAVMVASGAVPWTDAVAAVDAPTLVLLFGMMIVTAYLRLSGFFRLVMTWALRRARTPRMLLGTVVLASGVLSAFFVNDVVCLVLAPVVLEATRQLALPPVPYLLALVTAANVGSVATLTGNPQNMLVGSFSGISYRTFLAREAPIAVVGLVCVFAAIALVYRRQLPNAPLEITPDTRLAVHYASRAAAVISSRRPIRSRTTGSTCTRNGSPRRRSWRFAAPGPTPI
jgi:Na+/H+ antiporter NhaD/arsenite permease-like protein